VLPYRALTLSPLTDLNIQNILSGFPIKSGSFEHKLPSNSVRVSCFQRMNLCGTQRDFSMSLREQQEQIKQGPAYVNISLCLLLSLMLRYFACH
jgi:hypothetical protein